MASHRSVILVQLLDNSPLAGDGNSNCSSRFSSSSSLLVLALRLTAVSGALLSQLPHAAHAATLAVRPRLSFHILLLAVDPELATAASMSPEIAGKFISFVLELSILFIRPTELNFFFIAT